MCSASSSQSPAASSAPGIAAAIARPPLAPAPCPQAHAPRASAPRPREDVRFGRPMRSSRPLACGSQLVVLTVIGDACGLGDSGKIGWNPGRANQLRAAHRAGDHVLARSRGGGQVGHWSARHVRRVPGVAIVEAHHMQAPGTCAATPITRIAVGFLRSPCLLMRHRVCPSQRFYRFIHSAQCYSLGSSVRPGRDTS